jgi:hypothetical protein
MLSIHKTIETKRLLNYWKNILQKNMGRKREFVDAEISARLWLTADEVESPPLESPIETPPTWTESTLLPT